MDADGQNHQKLPRVEAEALYNELLALEGYSPDRQLLVLGEVACNSANCQLYLGPRESIENRSQGIWTDGRYAATDPVWSPDGSNIAFVWTRDYERTKNIFRAPPESNPNFIRLTSFGGKRDTKHPTYSPDSAQVAFATQDGPIWQIWVVDAYAERDCETEGECPSNPRNLGDSGVDDWDPLWIK
jgi:Tol biopolymer transport system component